MSHTASESTSHFSSSKGTPECSRASWQMRLRSRVMGGAEKWAKKCRKYHERWSSIYNSIKSSYGAAVLPAARSMQSGPPFQSQLGHSRHTGDQARERMKLDHSPLMEWSRSEQRESVGCSGAVVLQSASWHYPQSYGCISPGLDPFLIPSQLRLLLRWNNTDHY